MFAFLVAPMLALAAPQTAAPQSTPEYWQVSRGQARFVAENITFPDRAGSLNLTRASEFSRPGTGLDSGLQYVSRDREVFATVYIYYPGLAHAGLTSFATNRAIFTQSPDAQATGTNVVGAGGQDNVAIRIDYSGYRGNLASSAAFLRVGRWLIKIRVSGPQSRQSQVDAAMTALLDRMRFDGDRRPRAATPLTVSACGAAQPSARALPDGEFARQVEHWLVANLDGGGEEVRDEATDARSSLPSRIGANWCQTNRALPGNEPPLVILRAAADAADGIDGRSRMLVPINDAGRTFELVQWRDRHILLHHDIGRTDLLGGYEGVPSDDQLVAILTGRDRDGGRIRASITRRSDGGTETEFRVPTE